VTEAGYAVEATELHRDRIKRALRNKRRLRAIEQADVLDAAHTMPALNRAVRIVAHALRVPVVQLNVLTEKSLVPIAVYADGEDDDTTWKRERQAGSSYCKFVIWKQDIFQVDDARHDARVRQRHATRDLSIGAYLAVPIRVHGFEDREPPIIGTLCAIDHAPRRWTAQDLQVLTDIAAGTAEFIATRRQARSDARGVARLSDQVLEATAVGVLATDARGVMTYANPAATRMLGYTADEMHGRDQHALIHHSHPNGRKYQERSCINLMAMNEGRGCHTTNDTFWRLDGTPITVDSTMTPIFERGELVGTVLSFIDVTERRSEEQSAHSARVAAEVANRAKSELIAGMSAELGLSLVEIKEGSERLEALLRGAGTAQQVEEVKAIQRSHRHLVGLMDNLRQFATLEVSDSERAS
jgi:PAS domain S-box-containing protein